MEQIPSGLRPGKKELHEKVKETGFHRDFFGKTVLTPDDVRNFLEHLRAAPNPHRAAAQAGAGRLLSGGRPAPHEVGYIIVIGEQLNHNGYVFVGWAPGDDRGPADLLTLVQYGYPGQLVVHGLKAATPYQVSELKKQMTGFQVRTDDDNWYENTGGIQSFIQLIIKSKESIAELVTNYQDEADEQGKRQSA
jgi:hypothetical protein